MEKQNIYLITVILTVVYFIYLLLWLVKRDIQKFKKALVFDKKLNFSRLEKHYTGKVLKEKIFDDKVKKEMFLRTASGCLIKTILKGESAYAYLATTLEQSKEICERVPDFKLVVTYVGESSEVKEFLTKQLERYKKSFNEADCKNNPEIAKESARNNLTFFFKTLEHEDVVDTKLNVYFESEKKNLEEHLKKLEIINFPKRQQVTSN